MLTIIFSLKKIGRVGLVNKCYWEVINKATFFTITKMFVQMFLHAWYVIHLFTSVRSLIISPIVKSVDSLTYILFSTFLTCKKINQAFPQAVKSMISFISFFCNRTGETYKTVRLINICTNLAMSFTIKRPNWLFNWIEFSSNRVTNYFPRTSERDLVLKYILVLHLYIIDISYHK